MRINRWLMFGFLLACIVGIALVLFAFLSPMPNVTKENFDRIEVGMSRAGVEAIFGGRANRRSCLFPGPDDGAWDNVNANDSASIVFDENDRVVAKHWFSWPDERTACEKLLDRLPWRERPRRIPAPTHVY